MWNTELVLILRNLVGDVCSTDYSDARLEEVILVSAQMILSEFSFQSTYTVDVAAASLSPDPTDTPKDNIFIGLVTLKAACILARGALRDAAAREGIKVTDKMGSIEVKGRAVAAKEYMKTYCDAYQRAKLEYALNNINGMRAIFNVVIGPNIVTDWNLAYEQPSGEEYFN